jgi:hypothetical protein
MKITRVITRETDCLERGVPIVIEVHSRELVLRLKGERTRYSISYAGMYWAAARAAAERERMEKAAARRGKRP